MGTTGFTSGINSAILRYSGADEVEPTTNQSTSTNPLVETDLHPTENPGAVSVIIFVLLPGDSLILAVAGNRRRWWCRLRFESTIYFRKFAIRSMLSTIITIIAGRHIHGLCC